MKLSAILGRWLILLRQRETPKTRPSTIQSSLRRLTIAWARQIGFLTTSKRVCIKAWVSRCRLSIYVAKPTTQQAQTNLTVHANYLKLLAVLEDNLYVLQGIQSHSSSIPLDNPEEKTVDVEKPTKCTDIIRMTEKGIWMMSSFPCHFEYAFQHEDRLICDRFIYSL